MTTQIHQPRPNFLYLTVLSTSNHLNINKNKPRDEPFLWVNDDVSDETRQNRKAVRDVAALAKVQGCSATIKVHGDGIIVDSNKYKHSDLDLLPPKLSLANAKSRVEDTGIYFQGEWSPFSNYFHSRFVDDQGQWYESVEQAFQHKKASSHGKSLIACKILKTRNNTEIRNLSKQIQTKKAWLDEEEGLMEMLVKCKFTQNDDLRKQLIMTGNKQMHEATVDPKWGTGADLSSKALQSGEWSGKDLLGRILERVRDHLLSSSPDAQDLITSGDPSITEIDTDNDLLPMPMDEEEVPAPGDHGSHSMTNPDPTRPVASQQQTSNTQSLPLSPRQDKSINTTPTGSPVSASSPVSLLNFSLNKKKRAAPPPPIDQAPAREVKQALRGNQVARSRARGNQKPSESRVTRATIAASTTASKGKT